MPVVTIDAASGEIRSCKPPPETAKVVEFLGGLPGHAGSLRSRTDQCSLHPVRDAATRRKRSASAFAPAKTPAVS